MRWCAGGAPERVLAVAVDEEVEGLAVAVPPLPRVLAAARVAAEHGAVLVEQDSEARGNTDGVDEDEDVGSCLIGLI